MTKIIHLADLHFGTEDEAALNLAREEIKSLSPDGLIVAGDLTQRGARDEFAQAAAWLGQFDLPMIVVPGNHDTPMFNMHHRIRQPFARYREYMTGFPERLSIDGFAAAGLNTARGWQVRRNWAEGSVNLDDLTDRLSALGQYQNTPIRALVCHHPFSSPPNAPLRIATRRGKRASALLAQHKVQLLLCGHVHTPSISRIENHDDSYLMITSGTLSTRLRDQPPSFNVIRLSGNSISVDAVQLTAQGRSKKPLGTFPLEQLP